jgi:hypothetical protein
VNAKGAFAIDHFVPVSIDPNLHNDYDNLLYACVACTLTRGNLDIPSPLHHLLASTVTVDSTGLLHARTGPAKVTVEALHLNDLEYVLRRGRMITLLRELETLRPDRHAAWTGYPENLPDLSRLRPPGGNARKAGLDRSRFAQRKRGELPLRY